MAGTKLKYKGHTCYRFMRIKSMKSWPVLVILIQPIIMIILRNIVFFLLENLYFTFVYIFSDYLSLAFVENYAIFERIFWLKTNLPRKLKTVSHPGSYLPFIPLPFLQFLLKQRGLVFPYS